MNGLKPVVRNLNRSLRKYFVYIVVALLAVLVYASRRSFLGAKAAALAGGGGADVGACETLCGAVLGGAPPGGYILYADGSVEDDTDKFAPGTAANMLKKRACAGVGAAAPAAPPGSRRAAAEAAAAAAPAPAPVAELPLCRNFPPNQRQSRYNKGQCKLG